MIYLFMTLIGKIRSASVSDTSTVWDTVQQTIKYSIYIFEFPLGIRLESVNETLNLVVGTSPT